MQVPIEVGNLILLIGLILQVHWLLWYYFSSEFGFAKGVREMLAGGGMEQRLNATTLVELRS